MYINGKWLSAKNGNVFEVFNPADGECIGQVPDGGQKDTTLAIQSASEAFKVWSSTTAYARAAYLYEAHRIMLERQEDLARLMTREQGKPIQAARNEVKYGADFLLWFGEEAKRLYGQTIPSARPDQRFIVLHQPVGVVGAITPWNYPISMITRKVAPALAAGCTVVLKPAEATPLCAKAVFEVFDEAGSYYDKDVAKRLYENVMRVGDTIDPADGFRAFRGRDVDTGALLRKRGFPLD